MGRRGSPNRGADDLSWITLQAAPPRIASLLVILGGIACTPAPFACLDDPDCSGGRCEPSGWCSFEDDACASGRRYGRWVGDGLADACVEPEVAGTGTGSGTSTGTSTGVSTTLTPTDGGESSTTSGSSDGGTSTGTHGTSTGGGPDPVELVAWYPFDELARPGVVVDALGLHHGVCAPGECPAAVSGIVGGAGRFDGVDDLVRVVHDDGLDLGGTWTAAVWMSPMVSVGNGFQNLLGKPVTLDGVADTIELAVAKGTSAVVGTAAIDDGVSVSAPFAPGPDAWTHVAGTFDGTALRLYVDGVMVGEAEAPPPYFSAIEWTIGAGIDMGVPGTHFAGAIDELRLYRGALTPEEIAALVASP